MFSRTAVALFCFFVQDSWAISGKALSVHFGGLSRRFVYGRTHSCSGTVAVNTCGALFNKRNGQF